MRKRTFDNNVIQNSIFEIRSTPVILDRDISAFYSVDTRVLIQAVKRNRSRFPEKFCFQLNKTEFEKWRSQNVTSKSDRMGLRRPPYAFTEQGVAMLSAVLRSKTAVEVSVRIIDAFVSMRKFMSANASIFQRISRLECGQHMTEQKIERVLSAIEGRMLLPQNGIFYNGQVFDAWHFVSNLIRSAKESIILIDNYVDDSVLNLFAKRAEGVPVKVLTGNISENLIKDAAKFNQQYPPLEIKEFKLSHDRFVIIDGESIYHFGASLKDLGKKWFAFAKMDIDAIEVLGKAGLKSKYEN